MCLMHVHVCAVLQLNDAVNKAIQRLKSKADGHFKTVKKEMKNGAQVEKRIQNVKSNKCHPHCLRAFQKGDPDLRKSLIEKITVEINEGWL